MATGRTQNAAEDDAAEPGEPPPDIETMRATAHRALALAAPPTATDVTLLIEQLRGQVELMVTEVEPLAAQHAATMTGALATVCVGEGRRKLAAGADIRPLASARLAYARRLARVLFALCDHHRNLSGADS
ncbi:DUF6415 family natural product biosynthesis protein [Streptomyces sp. NPDC088350]|uniref:DUF6415 family natural product biosynthesis protein n=1 Tax=Streptomyces sp. NPDC088350 TaxID=3365854 RepID=UPI0038053074